MAKEPNKPKRTYASKAAQGTTIHPPERTGPALGGYMPKEFAFAVCCAAADVLDAAPEVETLLSPEDWENLSRALGRHELDPFEPEPARVVARWVTDAVTAGIVPRAPSEDGPSLPQRVRSLTRWQARAVYVALEFRRRTRAAGKPEPDPWWTAAARFEALGGEA